MIIIFEDIYSTYFSTFGQSNIYPDIDDRFLKANTFERNTLNFPGYDKIGFFADHLY